MGIYDICLVKNASGLVPIASLARDARCLPTRGSRRRCAANATARGVGGVSQNPEEGIDQRERRRASCGFLFSGSTENTRRSRKMSDNALGDILADEEGGDEHIRTQLR